VRDDTRTVCDLILKSSLHVLSVELYICMKVGWLLCIQMETCKVFG